MFGFAFACIASFLLGAALMVPTLNQNRWYVDLGINLKNVDHGVNVNVAIRRYNDGTYGDWETQDIHNVVVNIGLTRVLQLLYGNASDPTNATSAISLSNDSSPAAAWTKLANELTANGLDRQAGTLASTAYNSYTSTKTFTSSADSQTIQTAGLHWDVTDNSDNNMLAAASYTQVTLNTNDQIQITWTVSAASG